MEPPSEGVGVGGVMDAPRYYDQDGQPMAMLDWAAAFGRARERTLGRTILKGPARGTKWVSTVWLGLDHQWGEGAPLIFESMVFVRGSYSELECRRYTTRAEALAGHAELCRIWRWNHRQRRAHGSV
jgi:hypothetical protein